MGRKGDLYYFYLSFSFLSSVSHFYIGQCQVDNIKLSIFRYCQPVPFLALTSNRLYKRMRWNVKRKNKIKLGSKEERDDNRAKEMEGDQEAKKEREMDNSTE